MALINDVFSCVLDEFQAEQKDFDREIVIEELEKRKRINEEKIKYAVSLIL